MMSGPGFIIFWIVCIGLFGVAVFVGLRRIMRYENEQQPDQKQVHPEHSNRAEKEPNE